VHAARNYFRSTSIGRALARKKILAEVILRLRRAAQRDAIASVRSGLVAVYFPPERFDPTISRPPLLHRGQRVCIARQEPAAIGLFAVDRKTMTRQLLGLSAGARGHG